EFVVPMSLEVGRIIRRFESASTFNFKKLKKADQGYQAQKAKAGHSQNKPAPHPPCTPPKQLRTILHTPAYLPRIAAHK
ncbi:hypothetical protein, partial [Pseudomonas sp.]|uniref:hypothetical protein n=1 Tax=Pseudomonas sp. TaxID=306 RepID=UPI0028A751AF